jgi:hypothetical protein
MREVKQLKKNKKKILEGMQGIQFEEKNERAPCVT